jgi:hypothetical protein
MAGAQLHYPDAFAAPTASPVEMSFFDTIKESLCGEGKWRPLTLDTFFSEGWREPWAGGPAGQSGLTPRHGWLGSFEGLFYRLGLVSGTYRNNLNTPYGGEGYVGNFTTFLPFSRRFEMFISAPFLVANGTEDPTRGYRSDFGDVQVAASFLLSETEAFTQLFTSARPCRRVNPRREGASRRCSPVTRSGATRAVRGWSVVGRA